jgi:hypothetical protein
MLAMLAMLAMRRRDDVERREPTTNMRCEES